jgi:hypothetical protein
MDACQTPGCGPAEISRQTMQDLSKSRQGGSITKHPLGPVDMNRLAAAPFRLRFVEVQASGSMAEDVGDPQAPWERKDAV